MEIELLPTVSLTPDNFQRLGRPRGAADRSNQQPPGIQRHKILFICGNYSRILKHLNRNITELEVRCAFTVYQLMTILEENHHSFLIVEHDQQLYEDAGEIADSWLRPSSSLLENPILLYTPALELACLDCYKRAVAPYPDSTHSTKDKYLLPDIQSSLIFAID